MTNIMTYNTDTTTKAELKFLKYIRTLEIVNYRKEEKGVYLSKKDIESKFFPYPEYNCKEILSQLEADNRLLIKKGKAFHKYSVLEDGDINLNLLSPTVNYDYENPTLKAMKKHLQSVTVDFEGESTKYFDTFLKSKETHINHFFKVDNFARRVHTPVTNLPKIFREHILLHEVKTASLDVAYMQPLLLGKILEDNIGKNEFSDLINEGRDVYEMLQVRANLSSRKEAKKKFFEVLFSKPNDDLTETFGGSEWIKWVNDYKRKEVKENPRTNTKRHSNLAWLLQSAEVRIMYTLWRKLVEEDIVFVTVHDEVIVQYCDVARVELYFNRILKAEFNSFKLNIEAEEEIIHPFQINEYQAEEIVNKTVGNLCIEYSRAMKGEASKGKLKKFDLEIVVESIKNRLTKDFFTSLVKADYLNTHKEPITDLNLAKCIDYFKENRVFVINKYGRFDFN